MAIHAWPSTDIMDILPVETATFLPRLQRSLARAASSTLYRGEAAPTVWGADIRSTVMLHAGAEQIMALLLSMEDQLAKFYVWSPRLAYPQADPDGTVLGSATPVIASINGDNRRVTVSGLSADYVLTRGDGIGFIRESDDGHVLHKVVDATVTADGDGLTALFEIAPHIRIGTAVGDAVQLIKPDCAMVIEQGSLDSPTVDALYSRITFQTVEAP